jgi:hypothetical protein
MARANAARFRGTIRIPRDDARDLGSLLPGVQTQTDQKGRLVVTSSSVGLGYDETLPDERYGGGFSPPATRSTRVESA